MGSSQKKLQKTISVASHIKGWMRPEVLEWLGNHAAKCERIIEVGAWMGRTTKVLAAMVGEIVYVVDTWDGQLVAAETVEAIGGPAAVFGVFQRNLSSEIGQGTVMPLKMNSANAGNALGALLGDRKAQMVFIDGDHYNLARDLRVMEPFLDYGGLLVGHDYSSRWPQLVIDVQEHVPNFKLGPSTIWYRPAANFGDRED